MALMATMTWIYRTYVYIPFICFPFILNELARCRAVVCAMTSKHFCIYKVVRLMQTVRMPIRMMHIALTLHTHTHTRKPIVNICMHAPPIAGRRDQRDSRSRPLYLKWRKNNTKLNRFFALVKVIAIFWQLASHCPRTESARARVRHSIAFRWREGTRWAAIDIYNYTLYAANTL